MLHAISILQVKAACQQTVALWTTKITAFCKGDMNRAPHNTCLADGQDHGSDGHPPEGLRGQGLQASLAVLEAGGDFSWRLILHVLVHIICELGVNILKINWIIALLLKVKIPRAPCTPGAIGLDTVST